MNLAETIADLIQNHGVTNITFARNEKKELICQARQMVEPTGRMDAIDCGHYITDSPANAINVLKARVEHIEDLKARIKAVHLS